MIKEMCEMQVSRNGIDSISEKITEWGNKYKVNKKDLIRIRFSVEEALLSLCEKFGDEKTATVKLEARLETYSILVEYQGDEYNPLADDEQQTDDWTNHLLANMGQKAVYLRKGNNNILRFTIPKRRYKSEIFMILGLLLAILFGILGQYIPEAVRENISIYGLDFVSNIFLRLLSLFSGLLIFFALINGICGTGSVADFSKVGKTIMIRYIGFSFVAGIILTFLEQFFFHLAWGGKVDGANVPEQIESILLDIFPTNPVSPFQDGNMLQIIFLSVFLGGVLLILGDRVRSFKSFFTQGNDLITKSVDYVCYMLPVFVFTSLLSVFWEMGFEALASFWKPIMVAFLLALISPLFKLCQIGIVYHVSPFLIIRRLSKSVFVAMTTASGIASYSSIKEDLTKGLGIDEKFVGFSYPIGMNMYGSNYMLVYLTVVLFLTETYGTQVSVIWLAMAGFLSVVFAMATPNVSGATLICIGIIMANLGIPNSGLALAGTLSILLDFLITWMRHFTQELEVYIQARKFGKVDLTVLQKKTKQTN